MSHYIDYQRAKWERARKDSEFLAPMGDSSTEDIDLIKRWSTMKVEMYKQQGAYPCGPTTPAASCKDGRAIIQGRSMPQVTPDQAKALVDVWSKIGEELATSLTQGGKSAQRILNANQDFLSAVITWNADTYAVYEGQLYQGTYLYMPATDKLIRAIDKYVVELNSGLWAEYNIENAWERVGWALDNTPGGWLLKPFYVAVVGLGEAALWIQRHDLKDLIPEWPNFDALLSLIKWSSIGMGVYLLWTVLKPEKKKGGR